MLLSILILISIELFWPKSELYFNKIHVLCSFNYTILKIMVFTFILKDQKEKSQQFAFILFLKIK